MELRQYQREAVDSVWNCFRNKQGNPLIELPTGAGKSLVIAELCRAAVVDHAGQVIVLAHRKELLEQNYQKIQALLPFGIKAGLFSAGLRRYSQDEPIIVAGIQSCYDKASWFGRRHLVLVDEAHLVPPDGEGMFQRFLADLSKYNDRLRVGGLTATAFRTASGPLCGDGSIFTHISYSAQLRSLIEQGFLSPITSTPAQGTYDTSKLHVRGGEFVEREMVSLFSEASKVSIACQEIVEKTRDRHSILIFSTGVSHAEQIASIIEELTGEEVGVVTGQSLILERQSLLHRFAKQQIRWLVNVDVLTTGFDAPCIDAIAILRATNSPGLFAQICGRGLRLHASKSDCLVMDFGENIKRHGPLDALDYGKRSHKSKSSSEEFEGEAPKKECPNCKAEMPISRKTCNCGWQFPDRELSHQENADTESKILSEPEPFEVYEVLHGRHTKKNGQGPDSLRVDYHCKREQGNLDEWISEWICIEHEGFARRKAERWWKERCIEPCPATIDEAIDLLNQGALAQPRSLIARKEGKFWRVDSQTLDPIPQREDWLPVSPVLSFVESGALDNSSWDDEIPF